MMQHRSQDIVFADLLAYQAIHPCLHSSGQPTAEQFAVLSAAGVNTVINVALTDASNALLAPFNEDRIVLELGMDYVHLPLLWEQPSMSQAYAILQYIDFLLAQQQTVWVHCAKNMRVASLMYVYRLHWMNMAMGEAQDLLHAIWQPDDTWTGLIHALNMRAQAEKTTLG